MKKFKYSEIKVEEMTWYKGIVIYTDGWMCGFYDNNDDLLMFRTLSACKRFITINGLHA